MISEAQRFWDAIVGKVRKVAQDESKNTFRCERYEVTTAPNGYKMGVTLPLGAKEIFLPYSREVSDATVGSQVLVVWWGSMSNAKVYYYADGYRGCIFPIGYIYTSLSPTDPGTIFGGTWQRIGEGQVILSAGTNYAAGSTGGEASHTLTEDNIPAHDHGEKTLTGYTHFRRYGVTAAGTDIGGVNATSGILSKTSPAWSGNHGNINATSTQFSNPTVDRITVNATHTHDSFGKASPDAISNIQPYLAAYMWTRIA